MGEKDVGRDLHQNITDEEERDRRGVLGRRQVETLGHPGDLCGRDIVLVSHSQISVCGLLQIAGNILYPPTRKIHGSVGHHSSTYTV